jgi:hypothetical protein
MTKTRTSKRLPHGAVRAVFTLTVVQRIFWRLRDLFQCLEGAVRSGKTTIALLKIGYYCEKYPGLLALIARWKEKDAHSQLAAKFKELYGHRVHWNAREERFEFKDGSAVYVRGLKPSEGSARYSRFAGLTVALGYIDQPEEIPEDIFDALKARFSQPGMPHFCILTPNPVDDDHWLSRQFPLDNSRPGHRYIKTTVYDNRAVLGEEYIAQLELSYPEGHPLRRRYIEGDRGVSVVGTPVYKGYFKRGDHVLPVEYDPTLPLYEGWDYGHHHPAVTWCQFQQGGAVLAVLGGVQGDSLFLETFAPHVLRIREEWFPDSRPLSTDELRRRADLERARRYFPSYASDPQPASDSLYVHVDSIGDPSGGYNNSQGTSLSAETVLADFGIAVRSQTDANHPERRNFAIQTIAGYMQRSLPDGTPCFQVNAERFLMISPERGIYSKAVLVDGFELGYVWDELSLARTASPNTRRPKKNFPGDIYSHNMNGVEYVALAAAPAAPAGLVGQFMTDQARMRAGTVHVREYERQIRASQKDTVEIEHQRMMRFLRSSQHGFRAIGRRGGY